MWADYTFEAYANAIIALQVKTTWDENLYTTKLDKTKVGISEAEAARIATEIERQATRNRHMAEERGLKDNSVQEVRHSRIPPDDEWQQSLLHNLIRSTWAASFQQPLLLGTNVHRGRLMYHPFGLQEGQPVMR